MMGRLEELHMATVPESRPENQAPAAINNAVQGAASFKFGGDYKVLAYAKGGELLSMNFFETGGNKSNSIPKDIKIRQIFAESGFKPDAVSPSGALGIAQFMPIAIKEMKRLGMVGEDFDPFDPAQALPAYNKYMGYIQERPYIAKGDEQSQMAKALIAYNRGPDYTKNRLNALKKLGVDIYSGTDWVNYYNEGEGDYHFNPESRGYVDKTLLLDEKNSFGLPSAWKVYYEGAMATGKYDDYVSMIKGENPNVVEPADPALVQKMMGQAATPSDATSTNIGQGMLPMEKSPIPFTDKPALDKEGEPMYRTFELGGNLNTSSQETPLVAGSAKPTQTRSFALGGSLYEKLSGSQKKHFKSMYDQFIKYGYSEEMALVASSIGFKESNFKLTPENSYLGTSNDRLRNEVFNKNKFHTDVKEAGIKKGDRFKDLSDAQLDVLKQSDEIFFNAVYGGRDGNGPFESGDGYKYRGRGLNQLTQKNIYKAVSKTLFGDENVLVNNPDLVIDDEYAGAAAAAYYNSKDLGSPLSELFESVGLSKNQTDLTSDQLDLAMNVAYAKTAGLGKKFITNPNFRENLKRRSLYEDAIVKMKDFVSDPEKTIANIQGNQTPTQPTPITPEPAPPGQVPEYSETGEALNRAAELELIDYLNKVNQLGFDVTQESIIPLNAEDRALIDELNLINQPDAVPPIVPGIDLPQKDPKIPDVVDTLPQQLSGIPKKSLDDLESIVNQLPNEAQVRPSTEDLTTDPPTSPTLDPTTSPVINQLSPEVPEKQLSPEQSKRAQEIQELLKKTLGVKGVEFKGTTTPSNLDLAWQQASGSGVPFKDPSQQSAIANQLAPESSEPDPTKSARAQSVRSAGTMPAPKPSYEGGVPYKQSRSIIAGRTAEEEASTGDPSEDLRTFQSLIGSPTMDNVPNRAVKVDFTEPYKLTDKDREALTGAFRSVGALPPVPGEQKPVLNGGLDSTMKTGNFLRMMPIITSGAQALAAAANRPTPTPIGKFDIKTTDKAETLNVDPLIAKAEEAGATARQALMSSLSDPGQAMAALTTLASNLGKQKSDIAMQQQAFDTTQKDQLAKSQLVADSRNQQSRMQTAFANQADQAAYTDNLNQAFSAFSENLAGLGEEQRNREIIKLISPFDEQGRPIPEKLGYASQLNQLASIFGLKLTKP